jgi:hypothetical protein
MRSRPLANLVLGWKTPPNKRLVEWLARGTIKTVVAIDGPHGNVSTSPAGSRKLDSTGDMVHRFSDATEVAETAADASDPGAAREMAVGRYYMDKFNYTAAISRFKTVVTQYQASPDVEEALARLVESYLALLSKWSGASLPNREFIASEAQTAAAVLDRKFPTGHFSLEAHDALKSARFDPVENEKSWISRAFK